MNKNEKVWIRIVGIALILLALALVAYTYSRMAKLRALKAESGQAEIRADAASLVGESFVSNGVRYTRKHMVESYLIMGIDRTEEQMDYGIGGQSDVLLLLVLDGKDSSFKVLQINRDTITLVTLISREGNITDSEFLPICVAHSYGSGGEDSCENTVRAVQYLLSDIPIDGYLALDLNSIETINNAVGGVTVTIQEDLTAADPAFVKGAKVHLDDSNVEKFVRSRMILDEDNNWNRMMRQRQFLSGWLEKAQSMAAQNPSFLLDLLESLRSVSVSNLTDNRLSGIANSAQKYENQGFFTFEGEYVENGFSEFYPDDESIRNVILDLFYTTETVD
ncbi:MAG: LCP family protein [Oscillospiraceae bacterium]|nr:LCP family protein [Oscillospiraceae bacterium]